MALHFSDMAQKQAAKWKVKRKCQVYGRSATQWIDGEVIDIFEDAEVKHGSDYKEINPDLIDIRTYPDQEQEDPFFGWKFGEQCELYSRRHGAWVKAQIINKFIIDSAACVRVQFGPLFMDIFGDDIGRDLRRRGSRSMTVSVEHMKELKEIAGRHPFIAPVLTRIFAGRDGFELNLGANSSVDSVCID